MINRFDHYTNSKTMYTLSKVSEFIRIYQRVITYPISLNIFSNSLIALLLVHYLGDSVNVL